MRVLLVAALAALGCTSTPALPACDGSCLDVTVTATGLPSVRKLVVVGTIATEPWSGQTTFPDAPRDPIAFPAYFTLRLGAHTGALDLAVNALDGNDAVVATGTAHYTILPGARGWVTLALGGSSDGDGGARDASALDGAPDDQGNADLAPAVARFRVAALNQTSEAATVDLFVDGNQVTTKSPPGFVGPYTSASAGIHTFDVRSVAMPMTLVSSPIDLQPARLTTVYATACNSMWKLQAITTPTAPSGAQTADIYFVNASCAYPTVDFELDGMVVAAVPVGTSRVATVSTVNHVVRASMGGGTLAQINVTVAAGDVWSVFFYRDAGDQLTAAHDLP